MATDLNTAEPKLDTLQAVELAEGVEIRLRMAGPMLRMAACVIDGVIKFVGMIVVFIVLLLAGMALGDRVMWG